MIMDQGNFSNEVNSEQKENNDLEHNGDSSVSDSETQNGKGRLKWFILLVVVIVIFPVLVFFGLDFYGSASVNFQESDLKLEKISKSSNKDKNGYFLIEKALKKLELESGTELGKLTKDVLAEKRKVDKNLRKLVKRNKEPIRLLNRAVKKKNFELPEFLNDSTLAEKERDLTKWRRLNNLAALRALKLAQEGSPSLGAIQALSALKLGQKLVEARGFMIQKLVGSALKENGAKALRRINNNYLVAPVVLKAIGVELDQLGYFQGSVLSDGLKLEYKGVTTEVVENNEESELPSFIPDFLSGPIRSNSYFYNKKRTKKLFAEYSFRPLIDQVETNICKIEDNSCREKQESLKSQLENSGWWKLFTIPNLIGKQIYYRQGVCPGTLVARFCKTEGELLLTRMELAMKQRLYSKASTPKLENLASGYELPAGYELDYDLRNNRISFLKSSSSNTEEEKVVVADWDNKNRYKNLSASQKRDLERLGDIALSKMGVNRLAAELGQYPIVNQEHSTQEGSVFQRLTDQDIVKKGVIEDPWVNKGWYYSYKPEGAGFILTARLENLDSEKCIQAEKEKNGICIYKLRLD